MMRRVIAAVATTLVVAVTAWAQGASVDEVLSALNLDNVAKQRQLNDKGRADARALGDVFKRASVPFGRVYSSRFQRAVETARLAAGKDPEAITLIVTHKPNILDALGKDWFDVREGEASIFKPDGKGGSALVGRVQISEWTLAK